MVKQKQEMEEEEEGMRVDRKDVTKGEVTDATTGAVAVAVASAEMVVADDEETMIPSAKRDGVCENSPVNF